MKLNNSLVLIVFFSVLMYRCTPPVFEPPVREDEIINPTWSNTGKLNASFIATSRNFGVTTNTGSASFQISFIASSSNIDSLAWSFPDGITNDSISEVTETVTYEKFGLYDVGLEVFNTEDEDERYFEDFIEIYYKDDFTFTDNDPATWVVSPTQASVDDIQRERDSSGNQYSNWSVIPYTKPSGFRAEKQFTGFPKNNLILEFDYKLERIPVFYIDGASLSGTSAASPSIAQYASAESATSSDVRIEPPLSYPGAKRFSIEYNDIPIWSTSRINDEFFEHITLALPSIANFKLSIVKEAQQLELKEIPFAKDALREDNPVFIRTATLTPSFDIDGDGIENSLDRDTDGDGYLDATENPNPGSGTFISNPNDANSIPTYVVEHVAYPYNLHLRNITIKVRDPE